MPDEFEDAERAFWNELFGGMPADTRDLWKKQIVLVQDAVILGTLLDCFFLEDGKVGFSQVALKALPKFLTYRIPSIRGNEAPYRDQGYLASSTRCLAEDKLNKYTKFESTSRRKHSSE